MSQLLRALRSERCAELCWWYLLLLGATVAAKLACLASVYRHSDAFVLDEMTTGSAQPISRAALLALILARDILQTAAMTVLMFAVAALLPPRRASIAYRIFATALVLVILGNHVSFMQLGTFASGQVLGTAWGWVKLHPETLRSYLTADASGIAVLSVLGLALPSLLVRAAQRWRTLATLHRALPAVALGLVVTGFVCSQQASARFGERAFPVHGYWADVAHAAWQADTTTPLAQQIPAQAVLLAQYQKLAYAPAPSAAPQLLAPELESRIRPRHVIVVGLETAARAFYPLTTATDLPTFRRMTEHAIVSEHHYTTSPYTRIANFSILSGLYAPPSGLPVRFGAIATDGVAARLRTRGYETTYVDSWVLDWLPGSGEREQAHMLGFDHVIDSAVHRDDGVYEVLVKSEETAFDTAFTQIVRAQERGHKAAVFIGTMLGHSPWPAAQENQQLDGPARLHQIALVFDRLFAQLIDRLAERGLGDDVLILVVGDHGLRYAEEFESLGRSYSHSDLSFNVPFLLYAPGLVDSTVRVPYATSHIDITPTLLHLVGEPTQGLLHHGLYVLDERIATRILYLSNSRLGPLDGLSWEGHHFTHHALSGVVQMGNGADPSSMHVLSAASAEALPVALRDPTALLDAFAAHTSLMAGLLLQRGAAQHHELASR
ncbi:MAG TPA: sulfatase-like hydrolase/transferase [Polyangiales bacterium]